MSRLALIAIGLFFFQYSAQAAVPAIEREALVVLFNSTNGAEWRHKRNWLSGDPCIDAWAWVTCDQSANIIGLNLARNNQLNGSIPKEFATPYPPTGRQEYDLRWNALFTDSADLDAILDAKSGGDWSTSQTIAPANLRVSSIDFDSITLAWDPVEFTENEGGFRVWYGMSPGGPYMDGGITANKSSTSHMISGLDLEKGYFFIVTTETNSHADNSNLVTSENSNEIFVRTSLAKPTSVRATDGTFYYYRVKACNAQQCSKFSVANAGHRSDKLALRKDEINAFLLPGQQVPIPTFSTWGRWLLMLMTLGMGLVLLHRQYPRNSRVRG